MAKSVFLIHDVLVKPFARQLAIDLSLAGATVWLDEAEIGAVDSLTSKIDEENLGDVYLAIIINAKFGPSDWVQREIEIALNQEIAGIRIKLLPLLYSDCTIPAFMANKLCADFRNPAITATCSVRSSTVWIWPAMEKGLSCRPHLAGMWQGSWIWCGRQRECGYVSLRLADDSVQNDHPLYEIGHFNHCGTGTRSAGIREFGKTDRDRLSVA